MENSTKADMPMSCGCCACQGKQCLMNHVGHDHRNPVESDEARLQREQFEMLEEALRMNF